MKCDIDWIIALSGKLFYDRVNYHVNAAERQIFLKNWFFPTLHNALLEWKLEGWGKNGVQTMIVL